MPKVTVDRDGCKGCEHCTAVCPQRILAMSKEINAKGYFFARVTDRPRCIGCRLCAIACPDVAIRVECHGVAYRFFDY
ncbi:MAG: 4Fe-4S dicluster domain-containing protein [Candidatus Riflebacteria bacterium]|nr:4Fe-4S dicluster domain-containing protein [Candidatus Riflebacteria bacterium]